MEGTTLRSLSELGKYSTFRFDGTRWVASKFGGVTLTFDCPGFDTEVLKTFNTNFDIHLGDYDEYLDVPITNVRYNGQYSIDGDHPVELVITLDAVNEDIIVATDSLVNYIKDNRDSVCIKSAHVLVP